MCGPVIIVLASIVAFGYLEFHPKARQERARVAIAHENLKVDHLEESRATETEDNSETGSVASGDRDQQPKPEKEALARPPSVWRTFWKELLCQLVLSALFYGVLSSISSFLFARYSVRQWNGSAD